MAVNSVPSVTKDPVWVAELPTEGEGSRLFDLSFFVSFFDVSFLRSLLPLVIFSCFSSVSIVKGESLLGFWVYNHLS